MRRAAQSGRRPLEICEREKLQIESTAPRRRRIPLWFYAMAAVISFASPAASQPAAPYPSRPVKIVVPFPAGGMLDSLARYLGNAAWAELGESVIIDNRPGAGGRVGAAVVSRAAPDGQTLLFTIIGTMTVLPLIPPKPPYDAERDFTPIAGLTQQPILLAARSSLNVTSFAQFVALAKAQPGKLTYGSPGIGTEPHLATERLLWTAGINLLHVPYRGGGPEVVDFMAGRVDFVALPEISLRPALDAGKATLLGTLSARRLAKFPDVPPITELGHPNAAYTMTTALFAPAGVPAAVVDRWLRILPTLQHNPGFLSALQSTGSDLSIEDGDKLKDIMNSDRNGWSEIIGRLNLRLE